MDQSIQASSTVLQRLAKWPSWQLALVIGGGSRLLMHLLLFWQWRFDPVPGQQQSILCRWDCAWYVDLAANGYDAMPRPTGFANWAFFPAFPLLVRAVHVVSGLTHLYSGVVTSIACFLFGLTLLHRYCLTRMSAGGALFVVGAMAVSPFSLYFSSAFSESLFFLVSMLLLHASAQRQWVGAGALAGLLSATRPTGIIGAVMIAEAMWRKPNRVGARILPVLALSISGLLAFATYLWRITGDPLVLLHAQEAWNRSPGLALKGLRAAFFYGSLQHQYAVLCLFAAACTAALLIWYKEVSLALLIAGSTFIPALTGFMSLQRFAFTGAPLYVALAFMTERRIALRPSILAVLFVGNWWFSLAWLHELQVTM